jgi:hypothetical protein
VRFERSEGAKVHLFARRRRFALGVLVVGLVNPARADELHVSVACPDWTSEAAAQVEARIRTSFLTASSSARRVSVSCAGEAPSVEVEAERGTLLRPVVRRSAVLEDDVVAAAEDALHELTDVSQPAAPAEPAVTPAPSAAPVAEPPPPPPPPAQVRRETPKAPAPALAPVPSKTVWQLQAGPVLERWDAHWAVGAEAGVSVGSRTLGYGLALGGRAALDEPASFAANEWNLAARLQLAPARVAGFRGSLGLGASLLAASPANGIVADSSKQVSAAYFDLRVSRPFSLGSFALAPALGARVFSARRDVKVNTRERLAVPLFVPQVALWLIVPGD